MLGILQSRWGRPATDQGKVQPLWGLGSGPSLQGRRSPDPGSLGLLAIRAMPGVKWLRDMTVAEYEELEGKGLSQASQLHGPHLHIPSASSWRPSRAGAWGSPSLGP